MIDDKLIRFEQELSSYRRQLLDTQRELQETKARLNDVETELNITKGMYRIFLTLVCHNSFHTYQYLINR